MVWPSVSSRSAATLLSVNQGTLYPLLLKLEQEAVRRSSGGRATAIDGHALSIHAVDAVSSEPRRKRLLGPSRWRL